MGRIKRGARKVPKPKALRCAKKLYDTIETGGRVGRTHKTLSAAKKSAHFQAAKDGMMVRVYAYCAGNKSGKQILMGTCTSTGCDMRRVPRRRK